MKVYVVTYGYNWEHEYTAGVFSTKEKAIDIQKKYKLEYDWAEINIYTIDEEVK